MSHCTFEYVKIPATIIRDVRIGREASNSKEDIDSRKPARAGTPATARMKATSETPTTLAGMPAKAGSPERVRTSGTKGTPATADIETADMQTTAGTQATAKRCKQVKQQQQQ
jgi:hypothetical protein